MTYLVICVATIAPMKFQIKHYHRKLFEMMLDNHQIVLDYVISYLTPSHWWRFYDRGTACRWKQILNNLQLICHEFWCLLSSGICLQSERLGCSHRQGFMVAFRGYRAHSVFCRKCIVFSNLLPLHHWEEKWENHTAVIVEFCSTTTGVGLNTKSVFRSVLYFVFCPTTGNWTSSFNIIYNPKSAIF